MTSDHYRLLDLLRRLAASTIIAAAIIVLLPKVAGADPPVPAPLSTGSVSVRSGDCSAGDSNTVRAAAFTATAPVAQYRSARRVAIRLTLERTGVPDAYDSTAAMPADAARARTVAVPGWGRWIRSAAGRDALVVVRRVEGLDGPAAYRARAAIRWYDRRGRRIAEIVRRSPSCDQPDHRANLRVASLDVLPNVLTGERLILATIANDGRSISIATDLAISLGGSMVPPARIDPIEPGRTALVPLPVTGCDAGDELIVHINPVGGTWERTLLDNEHHTACP